jgi:hypothetical protein
MRILGAIVVSFGLTLLLFHGVPSHFGLAIADEVNERDANPDKIQTQTLSELPGPRDRKDLGIGEQVYCWIERPVVRPDDPAASLEKELLIWSVTDTSTMLPVVTRRGDRSILTVALSDKDGQLSINARPIDHKHFADDTDWQPAVPSSEPNADQQPVIAKEEEDDQPQRNKKLFGQLQDLYDARKTSFEKVEEVANEILVNPMTDKDRALIYFNLAELYAQSGMVHPVRVLEYSRRALDLPLEPAQRTTLYIYRGDACLVRRSDQTFEARCDAARREYFEGLKETSKHDLPNEAPARKMIVRFDIDDLRPDAREAPIIKQNRENQAHNDRVDFQSTLIQHRKLLWQQIKALHF